jgi:MoxR-like ATPase
LRIVRSKVPGIEARLADEVVRFVQRIRGRKLSKTPGLAESLDWAQALVALGADSLGDELVDETLGCVLKDDGDIREVRATIAEGGLRAVIGEGARA